MLVNFPETGVHSIHIVSLNNKVEIAYVSIKFKRKLNCKSYTVVRRYLVFERRAHINTFLCT